MLNKTKTKTKLFSIITIVFFCFLFSSKINSDFGGFYNNASADYTINDKNTFDEYKQKIEILSTSLERDYKINKKLSVGNLNTLKDYVNKAIDTFPKNNDYIYNNNIAQNLLISIDVVKNSPDSDTKITEMASNLDEFKSKIKIQRIKASLKAFPQSGNAPLTTTLRAENVIDPSGVILPQSNYKWRIKQSDGSTKTIGTGPAITYTFKEEKSYIVYLDIASASRNDKGKIDVLPFAGQTQIDVLPSNGSIYLYLNGINVSDLDKIKITPNIGKAGIVIDATASQPVGGSKFVKTTWDFGNTNRASYDYYPRLEKQYYVAEGSYPLSLNILTNENKTISKTINIDVRDPVASAKVDKTTGYVGDDFKMSVSTAFFDGKLSYEWKISDLQNDQSVFTSSQENFTYKFKKTGKFAVKLKSTAPSGKEDTDVIVVTIESRDPIATFESNTASSETPNTYKLDASSSFDPDTFDSSKLTFNWVVDGQKVELENPLRNGAIGKYTFNTEGNHKVVLEVSNLDGKTSQVKKEINITSLLSVKMTFSPKIVKMNSSLIIVAEAKEASIFEWNFGDGETDLTNNGRISHSYKKAGTYDLLLNVRGKKNGDSNSITRKVYVSNGDSPMANISLSRESEEIVISPDACEGQDAYIIDRAGIINFSGENSVNIDGNNPGLIYSWKYMNKTSSQSKFSYKFDELGCFPISLTVKSQKNGKLDTLKTYVKVENIAPKFAGLTITAPDTKSDPVIVKVTSNNPHDDDGVIVSYLWYYYTDSDPEPQDYRVTKLPETTFVLPKVTGKYYFVLIVEDSNGVKVNSENISAEKYSIQLATDNMNTPIIKLNADKTSISTGDEVSFDITVADILGKDITDKVEYRYDFDGDGFYDETSKSGKITHKFTKSGNVSFKVKVSYKGISNTKYQLISVKNVLKPNFEYYAIGKKLVIFNTSVGSYTTSTWDLGNNITSTNLHAFAYDFTNEDFPTSITLKIGDGNTNQSITQPVRKDVINKLKVNKSSEKLIIFTYPKLEDGVIHVTKNDSKVFIYLGESKGEINGYCIDNDTKVDSDLNGSVDDDCDNKGMDSFSNGSPYTITDFDSNFKERNIKVSIYNGKNLIGESKFNIVLDYLSSNNTQNEQIKDNKDISENDRKGIEELKDLIKRAPEKDRLKMSQFLSGLQENWFDDREKTKTVIDFESYVSSSSADQKLKDQFFNVLEGFLVDQSQAKDEVALAAKVLKSLIPKTNPNYTQIQKNIDDILSHPTNTKLNKDLGKFILESIKNDTNIPNKDKVIIKSQLQVIIYGSQKNVPEEVVTDNRNEGNGNTSSGIFGFIIGVAKWFLYIILAFVVILLGMFVFFKISNKNDNLSFQDFLIELFLKSGNNNKIEEIKKFKKQEQIKTELPVNNVVPEIQNNQIVSESKSEAHVQEKLVESITNFVPENSTGSIETNGNTGLPDWLKGTSNTDTTFASSEKTVESTETQQPQVDSGLPDWLKGTSSTDTTFASSEKTVESEETPKPKITAEVPVEEITEVESTETQQPQADSGLPDWLKGTSDSSESQAEQSVDSTYEITDKNTSISESNNIQNNTDGEIIKSNFIEDTLKRDDNSGLPDWLKGLDQDELKQEFENEISGNDSLVEEKIINENVIDKSESNLVQVNDDLPDWLKGSLNSSTEEVETEDIVNNESYTESNISSSNEEILDIEATNVSQEKKKPTSKKPQKDGFEDVSEQIKSPKPVAKKPKILDGKKEDQLLNKNNDNLPDWLK